MLTESVRFKTLIQKGNRIQVPKLVRWQHKMEPTQILTVGLYIINGWGKWENFYTKISKDGRIYIPKLTIQLLKGEKPDLNGYLIEVTLEPVS